MVYIVTSEQQRRGGKQGESYKQKYNNTYPALI